MGQGDLVVAKESEEGATLTFLVSKSFKHGSDMSACAMIARYPKTTASV
jgi:hypothetical protein